MNLRDRTLTEIAAIVSSHLRLHGVEVVVVGGSAITVHAPTVYTSSDIDLAVTTGLSRRTVTDLLAKIGFRQDGRSFAHRDTPYTIDFVADTPYIDQRPIHDFATIETSVGTLRVYLIEDAIADRIAGWLYWSDSQSLDVAERTVRATRDRLSWDRLLAALDALDTNDRQTAERMRLARDKLRQALGH